MNSDIPDGSAARGVTQPDGSAARGVTQPDGSAARGVTQGQSARPRVVTAAYALWLVAAVLLILVALLTLTVPVDQLRTSLQGQGASVDEIDSYLSTIRVVGIASAVLGLAVGLLSGPVRAGHARFRRILVVVSVVVSLFLVFVVFGLSLFQELLAVVLILLSASALVYRPSARGWFSRV